MALPSMAIQINRWTIKVVNFLFFILIIHFIAMLSKFRRETIAHIQSESKEEVFTNNIGVEEMEIMHKRKYLHGTQPIDWVVSWVDWAPRFFLSL